jgi:hypothetical protein
VDMTKEFREAQNEFEKFFIEYFTQDNLATAFPIYHVIKDKKKFWGVDTDYTDDWAYNCDDQECDNWSDEGDYHGEKELCDKCYKIGFVEQTVEHGMFLLRSEAEEHLKLNHYHYSDKAIVYTKHAWRSPRFASLINKIKEELSRPIKEVVE